MRLRAGLSPKDTECWGLGSEVGGVSARRPRPGCGHCMPDLGSLGFLPQGPWEVQGHRAVTRKRSEHWWLLFGSLPFAHRAKGKAGAAASPPSGF